METAKTCLQKKEKMILSGNGDGKNDSDGTPTDSTCAKMSINWEKGSTKSSQVNQQPFLKPKLDIFMVDKIENGPR